jgi:membrane protein DedA with SNARE-associated domain
MPWRRFAVANALGAFAWASTVATLASLVGIKGALAIAAAGFGIGGLTIAVTWLRHRRREALATEG